MTSLNEKEMAKFDKYYIIDHQNCDEITKKMIDLFIENKNIKAILCGHTHGYSTSMFALDKYQYGLKDIGWNSLFYENHDQRRSVGRFNTDDSNYRVESAKLLATTMYFLKGTPFIYQGQEIGMTNLNVKSLDEFVDIENVVEDSHEKL